jgi:hypothetical protein
VIVFVRIFHFEGDRDGGEEGVFLIGADVEHKAVDSGGGGLAEIGDAAFEVGNSSADFMPPVALDEDIQLDRKPGGGSAEGGVEDVGADHHRFSDCPYIVMEEEASMPRNSVTLVCSCVREQDRANMFTQSL